MHAVIRGVCHLVHNNVLEHEGRGWRENRHTSCKLKSGHIKPLLWVTEIPPITPSTTCFAHSALIKGLINIMHSSRCVEAPYLILSTSLEPISYSTLTSSWHQVGIRPVQGQNMAAWLKTWCYRPTTGLLLGPGRMGFTSTVNFLQRVKN